MEADIAYSVMTGVGEAAGTEAKAIKQGLHWACKEIHYILFLYI